MNLSKQTLTVIIIVCVIALVVGLKGLHSKSPVNVDPVVARSLGSDKARVNIVEFIDFECPACAQGSKILKDYVAKYPDQIYLQVKYYPLMNVHHHALQVAAYGECVARQGKFWQFFEPLMVQQAQWSQLVNAQGIFDQIAQAAGVNMAQLKTCVSSDDVSTKIMAEKNIGRSLGVQSTPTYFINTKMVVGTKSLKEELDTYFPKAK